MPLFLVDESWPTSVLAHNFWIGASFLLTAMAGFAYARAVSGSERGALVAGFLLAFCAFRFHHLEHLNLLSFYWIPLAALQAFRFGFRGTKMRARRIALIVLTLCGLGAAATSLTVLTLAGFYLVSWAVCVSLLERNRFEPRFAAIAVIAFFIGSLPITAPLLANMAPQDISASRETVIRYSPDLLGFLSPERSAVFGPLGKDLLPPLHGAGGRNMYLGLALLVLAGLGLWPWSRRGASLGITALLAFLVSLGPGLWLAGHYHAVPISFYAVLQHVPPFSVNRVPERFILVTLVALVPLAAIGFERLAAHRKTWPWALAIIVMAALELTPASIRAVPVLMPGVYTELRGDPHPGAVLELTLQGRYANDFAFHQIAHRRPIMMGPVNRPSGDAVEFLDQGRYEERLRDPVAFPSALRDLERAGVAFVIWHREGWEGPAWEILRTEYAKHAAVWFQDNDLIVLRLAES